MSSTVGTAAAAKIFVALSVLHAPTVSAIPGAYEVQASPAQKVTTKTCISSQKAGAITIASDEIIATSNRETTSLEKLIGEIRNWTLFDANWDGEGSTKPSEASIREAVSFARLISAHVLEPEPMLLASGHSALFWHDGDLYADLEFLGDSRVAYFIKKNNDKHKGVVAFDSESMPAVFQTLLSV